MTALGKQIQLELGAEILVTSQSRLSPAKNGQDTSGAQLPDLYPMDCTVSIEPQHFYTLTEHYREQSVSGHGIINFLFISSCVDGIQMETCTHCLDSFQLHSGAKSVRFSCNVESKGWASFVESV